jgi:hypothetical protein
MNDPPPPYQCTDYARERQDMAELFGTTIN